MLSIATILATMPNLLLLQKLLPPSKPMTERREVWNCSGCAHRFDLDSRVRSLPGVATLKRTGVLQLRCPRCQDNALVLVGVRIS